MSFELRGPEFPFWVAKSQTTANRLQHFGQLGGGGVQWWWWFLSGAHFTELLLNDSAVRFWDMNARSSGLGPGCLDLAQNTWTWPKAAGLGPKRLDLGQKSWT